ncbi:hypothetical protein IQ277_26645 [Nostocales cyanobacterium LEGE 12452]|nr:hypothetical protein [Nostocales cyanobacterium LEGE 12452]
MNQTIPSSLDVISQIDSLLTRELSDDVRQLITEVRKDILADTLTIKPLREYYKRIEEEWTNNPPFSSDYTHEIKNKDCERFLEIVKLFHDMEGECCCIDKPSQYAQHLLIEWVVRKPFMKGYPKYQKIDEYKTSLKIWYNNEQMSHRKGMKHNLAKPYIDYLIKQLEQLNNS